MAIIFYAIMCLFLFLCGMGKTRRDVFLYEIIALCFGLAYFSLIGSPMATLSNLLFILINIFSILMEKNRGWRHALYLLGPPAVACGWMSFKQPMDALVIAASALSLVAKFSLNIRRVRLLLALTALCWLFYLGALGKPMEAVINLVFFGTHFYRFWVEKNGHREESVQAPL